MSSADQGVSAISEVLDTSLCADQELLDGRETFVRVLVTKTLVTLRAAAPDAAAAVDQACGDVALCLASSALRPALSGQAYLAFSPTHRVKNRIWQAIAVLAPHVRASSPAATLLLDKIMEALRGDERKSVRYYAEVAMFELLAADRTLIKSHLLPLLTEYNAHLHLASSGMLVANFLIRLSASGQPLPREGGRRAAAGALALDPSDEASRDAVQVLAEALLPWVSHHSHHVRVLAALAVRAHARGSSPFSTSDSSGVSTGVASGGASGGASPRAGLLSKAALTFMASNEEVAALHARLEAMFFQDLDLPKLSDHTAIFSPVVGAGEAFGEQ
ncbi:hypothetical protein T484DRAFT_1864362, partial [Baffinella frigidus]